MSKLPMFFLAADPDNPMFKHNLELIGRFVSPSAMKAADPNLSSFVSLYEVFHTDNRKEEVFEKIRESHYPNKPSRMGALFLFATLQDAKRANSKWWADSRAIYEASIEDGSVLLKADSEWLNCKNSEYEESAHKYFQEKYSDNPLLEIVVMGAINVSKNPIYS